MEKHKYLKLSMILSLFVLASTQSYSQKKLEQWKKSGFSYRTMRFILQDSCSMSFSGFWGCLEASYQTLNLLGVPYDLKVSSKAISFQKSNASFISIVAEKNKQNQRVYKLHRFFKSNTKKNIKRNIENIFNFVEYIAAKKDALAYISKKMLVESKRSSQDVHYNINDFVPKERGKYSVGIMTRTHYGQTFIINILKNSNAEKSGLKVYDRIISVNNQSVKNLDPIFWDDVYRKNHQGTIKFTVSRDGVKKDIFIQREVLKITPYESFIKNNKIYIRFENFMVDDLCQKVKSTLLKNKKINSLVFDLRFNFGGRNDQMICILEMLTPKNSLLFSTHKISGQIEDTYSQRSALRNFDIEVLVNSQTKSAAEVFAAVLRKNISARIIGERTYGKFTAQIPSVQYNLDQHELTGVETIGIIYIDGDDYEYRGIQPDLSFSRKNSNNILRISDMYQNPSQIKSL